MLKKSLLVAAILLHSALAWAQNPTCPTRPVGDSSNACASTAFVNNEIAATNLPIVILTAGQSNTFVNGTFAWTPNVNAKIWNNSAGSVNTGTAYVALDSATVTFPQKFASDIATANPGRRVCLIVSGFNGLSISHWLAGTPAPDAYQDAINNAVPALAACGGATKIDVFLWWQGESDTSPLNVVYNSNYTTMMNRFWANSWFPKETPIMVYGIASVADGGGVSPNANQMNDLLQGVVNTDPDKRRFVYTSSLPSATYWSGSNPTHMTGQGYYSVGAMSSSAYLHGPGRNSIPRIVSDPVSGFVVIGTSNISTTPFAVSANSGVVLPNSSALGQFVALDSSASFLEADAFANFAGFSARRGNGTMSVPTKLITGDLIAAFGAQGYDAIGAVSGNKAGLLCFAAEDWNDATHHGTYCSIYNTLSATNTTTEGFRFNNDNSLLIKPQAFSILTACGGTNEGAMASVTDSTTNTWGAVVTGGGANHIQAYCNGTNWTVSAK